jgi:hypothetical protein
MSNLIERFHYQQGDSEEKDGFVIETVQDIEPIIEANKKKYNESQSFKSETFNQVASIPLVMIEKWKNEKGIDLLNDERALRQFLNDPENRFFRTRPGKV